MVFRNIFKYSEKKLVCPFSIIPYRFIKINIMTNKHYTEIQEKTTLKTHFFRTNVIQNSFYIPVSFLGIKLIYIKIKLKLCHMVLMLIFSKLLEFSKVFSAKCCFNKILCLIKELVSANIVKCLANFPFCSTS